MKWDGSLQTGFDNVLDGVSNRIGCGRTPKGKVAKERRVNVEGICIQYPVQPVFQYLKCWLSHNAVNPTNTHAHRTAFGFTSKVSEVSRPIIGGRRRNAVHRLFMFGGSFTSSCHWIGLLKIVITPLENEQKVTKACEKM